MSDELEVIEAAVRAYAKRRGATNKDADDLGSYMVRRTRAATEHAITKAGFFPERLKT